MKSTEAVKRELFGLVVRWVGLGLMVLATGCACCGGRGAGGGQEVPQDGVGSLFDGQTLTGWRVTDFAGTGEVRVGTNSLILERGFMTGVTWTNDVVRMNYELTLEAMRLDGNDFFCGLTFPVGKDHCSLVVGGWGGGVVGLSNLDGDDAANNETTSYQRFESGRWYPIRLRVEPVRIQAWIGEEQVVDADTTEREIDIRLEMESSKPLGIATWSTTGVIRNIRVRKL